MNPLDQAKALLENGTQMTMILSRLSTLSDSRDRETCARLIAQWDSIWGIPQSDLGGHEVLEMKPLSCGVVNV